jgi:hypothetical protein
VKLVNSLKKNNWVGMALYSNDKVPASVKVHVDLEKLGLIKKAYQVLLLRRNMKMWPPGREAHYATAKDAGSLWTRDDFTKGVTIAILPSLKKNLELPAEEELAAMFASEQKETQAPIYVGGKTNIQAAACLRETWEKNEKHRLDNYEIMVIAPYDELTIEGEKAD